MGQTSFDAPKNSESIAERAAKTLDTNDSIKKSILDEYRLFTNGKLSTAEKTNAAAQVAEKTPTVVDLNKLLERNPIYSGTDTGYVEKQWKNNPVDSPTDQDLSRASTRLKDNINPLLKDSDKAAISKAQEAILKGEPQALLDVFKQYKNDPAKLMAIVGELNTTLQKSNAHIGLKMDGPNVTLSGFTGGGMSDVTFHMERGKVSATFGTLGRASFDGTISKDPETVMKRMGNMVVEDANKHE
ncbi:MAG: hypothetical protein P4L53_17095 [Candidatus Obscuribacterales bacterium]|nr:hypothetical protein [Candidatus Obscuribacterales bacterium]